MHTFVQSYEGIVLGRRSRPLRETQARLGGQLCSTESQWVFHQVRKGEVVMMPPTFGACVYQLSSMKTSESNVAS